MSSADQERVVEEINRIRLYNTSPNDIVNLTNNVFTKVWTNVVTDVLMPTLKEKFPNMTEDQYKCLTVKFFQRLIQHGKIHQIMSKAEKAISSFMNVPADVVIPGDELNNQILADCGPSELELLNEAQTLMQRLLVKECLEYTE